MKKIIILMMAVLLSATTASAFIDSYTISHDKLPEEAQQMLTDYFPKAKVSSIKIDRHLLKKTDYDVRLTNGIKIEFSNKGKWTYVTSKRKAIPEDLIPAKIRKYVADNYPDVKIISIRKKTTSYEIGLSSSVLLTFNRLYKLTKTEKAPTEDSDSDSDSDSASDA